MAEICPVCNEEIISQYREVYKINKDSEGIVLHNLFTVVKHSVTVE